MMTWAIHVDDIIVLAKTWFLQWALRLKEERFGKIKRHGLPFTRVGMTYVSLASWHLLIHQDSYLDNLNKIDINTDRKAKPGAFTTADETFEFRSLLCTLLWLHQTREDIYKVVQLQQAAKSAQIKHLKQTNVLLDRAKRNREQQVLTFPTATR